MVEGRFINRGKRGVVYSNSMLIYHEIILFMLLNSNPPFFPLSKHVIRFHEIPTDAIQRILQWGFHSCFEFKWHNDLETRIRES